MSKDRNEGNIPEGRRVSKSSGNREALYLKRQQLLREMQSQEDVKPVPVKEQIEKLKTGKSSDDTKGPNEDSWGSKAHRKKGGLWILWATLALIIPIVLVGLLLISKNFNERTAARKDGSGLDFGNFQGTSKAEPQDWFHKNSGSSFAAGVTILETLSKEDFTRADVGPLVRSDAQAQKLLELQEAGQWSGFDLRQPTDLKWNLGSSAEIGFMVLVGVRNNFKDFRAYFVKQEEGMRFDVAATEALSDIAIVDLPGKTLTEAVTLRCWLAKEPHFDSRSDASLFSWYQVIAPNEVDFVWAYCQAKGELDEALQKKLNYGKLIGERQKQFRASIKVTNARGFRDDEFFLEDLLAEEWVLPEVE